MSEISSSTKYYIRVRGRILGPYDVPQLQTLRKRGQFSRANEVSTDRQTWQSAATIESLLTTRKADEITTPVENFPHLGSAGQQASSAGYRWYYSEGNERRGPIDTDGLNGLVAAGQVRPDDLVWREGIGDWTAVSSIPELMPANPPELRTAKPLRKPSRWRTVALSVLGITLLAGGGLAAFNGRALLNSPAVDRVLGLAAITSVEGDTAESQLSESVGLVVCGFRSTLQDGSLIEEVIGTGTCFVVSRDGHALTNKHVIEEIERLTRAQLLLDKVRKELLIEIEPRVWVFFGSRLYNAKIITTSENFDLGILKVERQCDAYFRLNASDSGLRGQKVYALGFPGAAQTLLSDEEIFERLKREQTAKSIKAHFKPRDLEFSMTIGAVSKISKESEGRVWIQHNADINPGNSGGPLVTPDGVVHGINTGIVKEANGVFFSLTTGQLRQEIDQHIPNVHWK